MTPVEARKDCIKNDPDFCYDCCLPVEQCACEPEEHGTREHIKKMIDHGKKHVD
jgi:hypothetical protein